MASRTAFSKLRPLHTRDEMQKWNENAELMNIRIQTFHTKTDKNNRLHAFHRKLKVCWWRTSTGAIVWFIWESLRKRNKTEEENVCVCVCVCVFTVQWMNKRSDGIIKKLRIVVACKNTFFNIINPHSEVRICICLHCINQNIYVKIKCVYHMYVFIISDTAWLLIVCL